jgi:arginase
MARDLQLFAVPYDAARRDARMGKGPGTLLAGGLVEYLGQPERTTVLEWIDTADPYPCEIGTTFDLARRLAGGVRSAVANNRLPLVLAGNCFMAVGTLAGLGGEDLGVVWLDCHGDFNTPETTQTGFLDGMALATVTGQCWAEMAAAVPGFRPLPDCRILHLGGRDFDPGERERLEAAGVVLLDAAALRRHGPGAAMRPALAALANVVRGVYLHIDLDALDPDEAPANSYQTPNGLVQVSHK